MLLTLIQPCGILAATTPLFRGPSELAPDAALPLLSHMWRCWNPIATQELLVRNTGVREISYSGERQATRTWQEFQENKSRKSRPQP